jgi:hypothetical protein
LWREFRTYSWIIWAQVSLAGPRGKQTGSFICFRDSWCSSAFAGLSSLRPNAFILVVVILLGSAPERNHVGELEMLSTGRLFDERQREDVLQDGEGLW